MSNKFIKATKEGKTIHIGVEGANFMHLLRLKLTGDPRYSNIWLWDFMGESDGKLVDWLRLIKLNRDRGIKGIGVLCDIDKWGDSPRQSRVDSVTSCFKEVFDIDLQEAVVSNQDNISFGFRIVPTTADTGCLETALLENASSIHMACAEDYRSS